MRELDLYLFMIERFLVFVMVLARFGTLFFLMPIFSSRTMPTQVKIAFAIVVSLVLTPIVPLTPDDMPKATIEFFLLIISELFIGMSLALIMRLIFSGLQTAGQIVGFQIGFSVANVMDPQTGTQSVVIAQFAYIFALLLFLSANGHHYIIRTIYDSFWLLRPGELNLSKPILDLMIELGARMFILSVKLMAPVMAVLLLAQVALGILAKTVPQMNMLMMSFGINIILGLFFFGITLQVFWPVFAKELDMGVKLMPGLIQAFAGR